jgi:hypothetical protein
MFLQLRRRWPLVWRGTLRARVAAWARIAGWSNGEARRRARERDAATALAAQAIEAARDACDLTERALSVAERIRAERNELAGQLDRARRACAIYRAALALPSHN